MCLVELQLYVWVSDAHFLAAERSKCLVNLSHVELCGFLEVKVKVIIITIVIARPDIRLCVRVWLCVGLASEISSGLKVAGDRESVTSIGRSPSL